MSEKLKFTDTKELLNPNNTPELGFQSYEMLKGNGARRESEKNSFLSGETSNPELDYPRLDVQALDEGIRELEGILTRIDTLPELERDAIWDSVAYRMAEMYWLKGMHRLNEAHANGDERLVEELVPQMKELGEQLYGSPNEQQAQQILGEIVSQVQSKELASTEEKILEQLQSGFSVTVGGEEVKVEPLDLSAKDTLPVLSKKALNRLREKLHENFSDILELVEDYYEYVVAIRPEGERHFTPQDMYDLFTKAHELRDPDGHSGVTIIIDPDASALSWETPKMAVIVGGRRAPITSVAEMQGKIIHEYGIHGGRAVQGVATELPILGTDVYSDAEVGEASDYLTFEEGLASLCEKALQDGEEKWKPIDIERTLAAHLAYQGYDFRQTYETLWRLRVLFMAKDNTPTTEASIEKAQRNAYTSCERIFRGTPTRMSRKNSNGSLRIITFNKDLAYLSGKTRAAKFIEESSDEDFDLSFRAKIDPTNHRQLALAKSVMLEK